LIAFARSPSSRARTPHGIGRAVQLLQRRHQAVDEVTRKHLRKETAGAHLYHYIGLRQKFKR